jgi:hypothetical protein
VIIRKTKVHLTLFRYSCRITVLVFVDNQANASGSTADYAVATVPRDTSLAALKDELLKQVPKLSGYNKDEFRLELLPRETEFRAITEVRKRGESKQHLTRQ